MQNIGNKKGAFDLKARFLLFLLPIKV